MTQTEYVVSLEGVLDREAFFASFLAFYAPIGVILTTWGEIPPQIQECLAPFRAKCSWVRRHVFHQSEWHLTPQSLPKLTQVLCDDRLLFNLTWGLVKSDTPLGLCKSWDDIDINGSDQIEKSTILQWLDDLTERGILQSYEIITD